MTSLHRRIRFGLALIAMLSATGSVLAALAPLIAGNIPGDSVWVTVSVNDTLGNAADADTIIVHWMKHGVAFDSSILTAAGYRTGQYVITRAASDAGATGVYQVFVRARVQGRTPITNYAYQVVPGGVMPMSAITDSGLARAVTADLYKADLAACGLGTGAIPCTLSVMRVLGSDTMALQGAFVRVYNARETATAAFGTSDANGRLIFSLAADTFLAYGYLAGYHFTPRPGTVIVAPSGGNDTLWADAFDPGLPATAGRCRVYGWVGTLSGDSLSGATVHVRINQSPLRYQNLIILPYELTAVADSAGYWFLDLIPSSVLTPDTTRYEFTIRYASGAILRRVLSVPDSTQWLLTW